MKWLLITSVDNPGDRMICAGVKKVIRSVDKNASFDEIDKEDDSTWLVPRDYDKAVLCGMPLFWSNREGDSQDIGWWNLVTYSWATDRKKDFLVMGVGQCVGPEGVRNVDRFTDAIDQIVERAWRVTVRSPLDHPDVIPSVCPAAFNFCLSRPGTKRFCNIMRDGGGLRHINERESDIWRAKTREIARYLIDRDFDLVAHSRHEFTLGHYILDWPAGRMWFPRTTEEYLQLYSQGGYYVGNRVHGAIVMAGSGAHVLNIGLDSRGQSVQTLDGASMLPSQVNEAAIDIVLAQAGDSRGHDIAVEEFSKMQQLVKEFMAQ